MALETELAHLVWDNPDLREQVFILYPSRSAIPARCPSGLADRLDGPPTQHVLPYEDAIASWVGGEMRHFSPVPRQEPTHPRARRIEVIDHYWCLWVDLDDPHGLESVEARLRPLDFWPSAIVDSGNRGFHLYFRLALSVPIALIELYNRALAELVGGDVTSPAMPNTRLRVPGTVNERSGRSAELVEMSGAAYGANALTRLNAGLLPALEPMMQKLQRRRQAAERRVQAAEREVAAAERRRQKVEQREERVSEIRQELDRRGERQANVNTTVITSGTYTPTLTNTTNISASTPRLIGYLRVGSMVQVSGCLDIEPTAGGSILLGISLPVASDLANDQDCGGAAGAVGSVEAFRILSDTVNNRASLAGIAVDTSNHTVGFTFGYQVK